MWRGSPGPHSGPCCSAGFSGGTRPMPSTGGLAAICMASSHACFSTWAWTRPTSTANSGATTRSSVARPAGSIRSGRYPGDDGVAHFGGTHRLVVGLRDIAGPEAIGQNAGDRRLDAVRDVDETERIAQ